MSLMSSFTSKLHQCAFTMFPLYITPPPMGASQRLRGSIRNVHRLVSGSLPENAIEELAAIAVNNFNLETPVKTISYRGFQDETDMPLKALSSYVTQICKYRAPTFGLMSALDVAAFVKATDTALKLQESLIRREDPSTIRVVVFRFEIGKDIHNVLSIFQNDTPIQTNRAVQYYQQPG